MIVTIMNYLSGDIGETNLNQSRVNLPAICYITACFHKSLSSVVCFCSWSVQSGEQGNIVARTKQQWISKTLSGNRPVLFFIGFKASVYPFFCTILVRLKLSEHNYRTKMFVYTPTYGKSLSNDAYTHKFQSLQNTLCRALILSQASNKSLWCLLPFFDRRSLLHLHVADSF